MKKKKREKQNKTKKTEQTDMRERGDNERGTDRKVVDTSFRSFTFHFIGNLYEEIFTEMILRDDFNFRGVVIIDFHLNKHGHEKVTL